MSEPLIDAHFSNDLNTCDLTIWHNKQTASYHGLIVKKINLTDRNDPQFVYIVKIPCAKALGQDYMASFGLDAIYHYEHPERQPIFLTPIDDEQDNTPKQLGLFGDEKS